jgi:hypothetical protein
LDTTSNCENQSQQSKLDRWILDAGNRKEVYVTGVWLNEIKKTNYMKKVKHVIKANNKRV